MFVGYLQTAWTDCRKPTCLLKEFERPDRRHGYTLVEPSARAIPHLKQLVFVHFVHELEVLSIEVCTVSFTHMCK